MEKFVTRHFAEILSTTGGREQILEPVAQKDLNEIDLSRHPGAYFLRFVDRREIQDDEGRLLTSQYFNESYPYIVADKVLSGAEVVHEAPALSNAKHYKCLETPDKMWVKFREGAYEMIAAGITVIDQDKNILWQEPLIKLDPPEPD